MGARAERSGPGLVRSLAGAMLLGAIGFALGLGVGASWEDPDLLLTALAGGGQTVELAGGAEAPGVPEVPAVAAPPPLGARDVPDPVASSPSRTTAAPVPGDPAVPAPGSRSGQGAGAPASPGEGTYAVQVGAFGDAGAARALERRLTERGFQAFVARGGEAGHQRWRVRVGPVAGRSEAEALAERLKREQELPTWVVVHGE